MEQVEISLNIVDIACIGVALTSVAAGIFTFGRGTIFGLGIAGSFCIGWTIGQLAAPYAILF